MTFAPYIRSPRTAQPASLTAQQVANAYNFPSSFTGKGATAGVIELGGGFNPKSYPYATSVPVAGGSNTSDGVNGADGEVQLDIEVIHAVAPGAALRVYFCPNTDAGFEAAVKQAIADKVTAISISWGQAENQWSAASIKTFSAIFLAARQAGIPVFAAAGDSGSDDSTNAPVTDYPASDPNVIGCGGTRLTLNAAGARSAEVVWDDNDTSSATGGGVSKVFPGRQVPDIAGNADPDSGYEITVDGESLVIGGTSAVAPLYCGLALLLAEAAPSVKYDLMNLLLTNLGVCFDVTSGDNGAYRAGPGRDDVTGLGVVDGGKLLAVITGGNQLPAPVPTPTPGPTPVPTPAPSAGKTWTGAAAADVAAVKAFAASPHVYRINTAAAKALKAGKWS